MQAATAQLPNCGIDLLPGRRVMDLHYADDIALLGEDACAIQSALDLLVDQLSLYELHISPGKLFLQDWTDPTIELTIDDQ